MHHLRPGRTARGLIDDCGIPCLLATPAERYGTGPDARSAPSRTAPPALGGPQGTAVGAVLVSWQQVSVGRHRAGERCDVHVGEEDILRLWIGNELLRTVKRASSGPVRNKRPLGGVLTKSPRNATHRTLECQGSTDTQPSRSTGALPGHCPDIPGPPSR